MLLWLTRIAPYDSDFCLRFAVGNIYISQRKYLPEVKAIARHRRYAYVLSLLQDLVGPTNPHILCANIVANRESAFWAIQFSDWFGDPRECAVRLPLLCVLDFICISLWSGNTVA